MSIGIAPAIVAKLHDVLRTADFQQFTERNGGELLVRSHDFAQQLIKADYKHYGKLVRGLSLSVD